VVQNVVDQLRQFGETRRGWLGVRIQDVSDDVAEAMHVSLERLYSLVDSAQRALRQASASLLDGSPDVRAHLDRAGQPR
jgi:serine protease Do